MTTSAYAARSNSLLRTGKYSFLALAREIGATRRQRRHLGALDDAALNDIGLTREQANTEASRLVWDVPPHWRS